MSILSQLIHRKITFSQAASQAGQWIAKVEGQVSPDAAAALGQTLSDLKQAASNAVMFADSLAGPLIATAAEGVDLAFDTAAKAYLGPFGAVVSPAAHDAIDHLAAALKAQVDASALATKAALQPAGGALGPLIAASGPQAAPASAPAP